jgi:hypothetical protein
MLCSVILEDSPTIRLRTCPRRGSGVEPDVAGEDRPDARMSAMDVVSLIGLWIILSIAATPIIGAFLSPAHQDRAGRARTLVTGKSAPRRLRTYASGDDDAAA